MARFKFKGQAAIRSFIKVNDVEQHPPILAVRIRHADNSFEDLRAPDQIAGFQAGQDIGSNVTDERVLRHLRADPRFEEIV